MTTYRAIVSHSILADATADGTSDHAAIESALDKNPALRQLNPFEVLVRVYTVYSNGQTVTYVTTLGKYRLDTE